MEAPIHPSEEERSGLLARLRNTGKKLWENVELYVEQRRRKQKEMRFQRGRVDYALSSLANRMRVAVWNHPTLFTLATAVTTAFTRKETNDEQIGVALAYAVGADCLKYIINRNVQKESRTAAEKTNLAKIMEVEYLNEIIHLVREYYGHRGEVVSIEEDTGKQDGTGIFKSGYSSKVRFRFADGNTAEVFYKYSEKHDPGNVTAEREGRFTNLLHAAGFEFVPHVFIPFMSNSRFIRWLRGGWSDEVEEKASQPNRGVVYEYIDGETLEMRVRGEHSNVDQRKIIPTATVCETFRQLGQLYMFAGQDNVIGEKGLFGARDDVPLEEYRFHHSLVSKLEGVGEKDFARRLRLAHLHTFNGIPLTIVHGDLHQGNIIETRKGSVKIIDWDNAAFGVPYEDFFHFAVISDFERSTDFEKERTAFVKAQEKQGIHLSEEHLKLIEFETYLSLFARYQHAIVNEEINEEFWENMHTSCRYLLEGARKSVTQYADLTGNRELADNFEKFAEKTLVESITSYNPLASIAYAHRVNANERKLDKREAAVVNFTRHAARLETSLRADQTLRAVGRFVKAGFDIGLHYGAYHLIKTWAELNAAGNLDGDDMSFTTRTVATLGALGVYDYFFTPIPRWIKAGVQRVFGREEH